MTIAARWWRWLIAVVCVCSSARAGGIEPYLANGGVAVSAPTLRLLEGRPLERLKNGLSVAFDFRLVLAGEARGAPLARSLERFVVSYDLWEEKFAVTRVSAERRSATHLAPAAVEAWCLENLVVPAASFDPERKIWVRLEVRAEEMREQGTPAPEQGISLTALVELFSRPRRGEQPRWMLEAGPLRLRDLRKGPG